MYRREILKIVNKIKENSILLTISLAFIVWSFVFIYQSSFIAIDGKRYFSLFDDAMISMRYAWNFSHGFGLVWNEGEYVQGYTNLLMTLLMSFATFVFDKSNAVLFIQLTGIIFMLAIAYISMHIADYIVINEPPQTREFIRILTFFCALTYYPLTYWSLMGMETGLLSLLLLLSVLFSFHYVADKNSQSLFSVSVFLGLAFLTRSDSAIFAILIWIYIAWEVVVSRSVINFKALKLLLLSFGLYVAFAVSLLLFQYLYYDSVLPNTYTLKLTGMALTVRLANGFRFVIPFLKTNALLLILSGLEVIFNFQKKKLLLISTIFFAIGYEIYVGGDPWNYWRIMAPFLPLIAILFVSAVNDAIFAIENTEAFSLFFLRKPMLPEKYINKILVVSIILTVLLLVNSQFFREILYIDKPYTAVANQRNVNRAIALSQLTTDDATIGVTWAGSTPYFVNLKAIDFLGKSDRYIAKLPPDLSGSVAWLGMNSVPGHNKYDLNYSIKTLLPTYIPNFKYGRQDLSEWAKNKYIRVEYNGVELFLLKDSPNVYWNKIGVP